MNTLKSYYLLTKPGIIRGNLMTALAGFLLASKGHVAFTTLLATLAGTALIIACGCVFNNYLDRGIDAKMDRTKNRSLVTGEISVMAAIIYACCLGAAGFWLLAAYTNSLTVVVGVIGLFSYVVLYGYFKRASVHGTLIGSISGSTSLVAGYTAVTGRFDTGAVLLFLIMAAWQMPHFYAIGVYRLKDYKEAGLPILPVKRGVLAAKKQIIFYIALFAVAACSLTLYHYTGYLYLAAMLILNGLWLQTALKGLKAKDNIKWGKQVFGYSLLVLLVFSFMISTTHYLP